jgi:hypothetical protein
MAQWNNPRGVYSVGIDRKACSARAHSTSSLGSLLRVPGTGGEVEISNHSGGTTFEASRLANRGWRAFEEVRRTQFLSFGRRRLRKPETEAEELFLIGIDSANISGRCYGLQVRRQTPIDLGYSAASCP